MDGSSNKVLKALRKENSQTLFLFDREIESFCKKAQIKSPEELMRAIGYLVKKGYVEIELQNGRPYSVTTTHEDRHRFKFTLEKAIKWCINNWIALAALIISIIALFTPVH